MGLNKQIEQQEKINCDILTPLNCKVIAQKNFKNWILKGI